MALTGDKSLLITRGGSLAIYVGLQHDGSISQSRPRFRVQAYESLMGRLIAKILVSRAFAGLRPTEGFARVGSVRISCQLGRSGIVSRKREGDGATPRGRFIILAGYFRNDRLSRPSTHIPLKPTKPTDGWCDDPTSFQYNRATRLPSVARCERMCLDDHVYDIVLVTSHNTLPRRLGAGSAIFVHFKQPDGRPTQGCIAFAPHDLRRLLPRLARNPSLVIK